MEAFRDPKLPGAAGAAELWSLGGEDGMGVRFTIARLFWVIVACGIALAVIRSGSEVVASAVFSLTLILLLSATLIALLRPHPFWAGFAVLGWGSLIFTFGPWSKETPVPKPLSMYLLKELYPIVGTRPATTMTTSYNEASGVLMIGRGGKPVVLPYPYMQIGHSLVSLLVAIVGGSITFLVLGYRVSILFLVAFDAVDRVNR
jgi:hypothetical protein